MRRTERTEAIAVGVAVLMAAGMITVALITHSIAIMAEGVDGVIDVVASLSVLIGLRLSLRRSNNFPMGLYKVENLLTTAIGVLILIGAYDLGREAIERLASGEKATSNPWLMVGTMGVVVVLTFSIAYYKGKVGREENSPSLQADGKHAWADAWARVAIIVGVGIQAVGVKNMDSIVALAIVLMLFWTGVTVTVEGLKVLLDASIESDLLDKTRSTLEADPRVRSVLSIEGRNSGSYRFLQVSLIPWESDLRATDTIAEALASEVKEQIENVDHVVFDFRAGKPSGVLAACPVDETEERLSQGLGTSSALEVLELDTAGRLYSRQRIETPGGDSLEDEVRRAVLISRLGVDVLLVRDADTAGAAYQVLDANGVEVLSRPLLRSLEDAVEEIESRVRGVVELSL
jgi:cation diffusion facilitator family transporter